MAIPELKSFILLDVKRTNRELGSGAYGIVEEVEIPGAVCAAKRIHESLLQSKEYNYITSKYVSECKIMSTLRHPHIVQFMGVCYLPGSKLPSLIMERMETSLHNLLESGTELPLSLKRALLLDVAKGLYYLHSHSPPIIHRDLTATNVLLNSSLVAKITDLGVARIIDLRPDQLKAIVLTKAPGNVIYMPPEALDDDPNYDASLDIFSFGNIALFTLTQQFPDVGGPTVTDPNTENIIGVSEVNRRKRGFEMLNRLFKAKKAYIDLTFDCLQNVAKNRPSAKDLVERLSNVPTEDSGEDFKVLGNLDLMKKMLVLKEENKHLSDQVSDLSQQVTSIEEDCKKKLQAQINAIEGRLNEAQVCYIVTQCT